MQEGRREEEGVTQIWVDHPQTERDQGLGKPEEKKKIKGMRVRKRRGKGKPGRLGRGYPAQAGVLATGPHPVGPGAQLLVRLRGAPGGSQAPSALQRGQRAGPRVVANSSHI